MSIQGLQHAQRANLRWMAAFRPGGAFERTIHTVTTILEMYAVTVTHVDTGSLRSSHREEMERSFFYGLRGRIYLDPAAINPRTGALPSEYGAFEEARGGQHAFYLRTFIHAPAVVAQAAAGFVRGLR